MAEEARMANAVASGGTWALRASNAEKELVVARARIRLLEEEVQLIMKRLTELRSDIASATNLTRL